MFVVVGVNHKTAEVDLRERLHFSTEDLPRSLEAVRALPAVAEVLILSTCNRVEIVATVQHAANGAESIAELKRFLLQRPQDATLDLSSHL